MEKKELEQALLKAENVTAAKTILAENGTEVSDEEAAVLYEKVKAAAQHGMSELSEEELAAVSGGYDRDWLTDGCAATVEANSFCWGTDGGCYWVNLKYDHMPLNYTCSYCGVTGKSYFVEEKDNWDVMKCTNCGRTWNRSFFPDF